MAAAAALALVTQAGGAGSLQERVALLSSFARLAVQQEPACLLDPAVLHALTGLASDGAPELRALLASVLPEVAERQPHLLPLCVACCASVLRDQAPRVAKQALLAAVPLFRLSVVRASQQVRDARGARPAPPHAPLRSWAPARSWWLGGTPRARSAPSPACWSALKTRGCGCRRSSFWRRRCCCTPPRWARTRMT